MNDNPGGGCLPAIIWLVIAGVVLAVIGSVVGIGPMAEDKYHCYTQPVGPTRTDNMLTGLSKEQVVSRYGAHQIGANCFLTR